MLESKVPEPEKTLKCPNMSCEGCGKSTVCYLYAYTTCERFKPYFEELKKHDQLMFRLVEEDEGDDKGL